MRTIALIGNYRQPMSFLEFGVLAPDERHEWEVLYHAYAEYYQLPMNAEILETVWS
ncbi:MAG: hypothetical protein QGI53_09405 [SAR324 cluster bacterium]|jgi:hypothetical protein|uniref:Uncharacterized protein n=1 Tax=marine metagenome TaxID=408172 RepID=A0A381N701_9ZZZZ|nr:hypothetical protein [SAR324 cluster bacterium]MDP6487126.1 hypothetical protein [SAR324 cluster bacterium]MDP7169975.1 hypothetical protein [SAR324 cluster bacterium]MDP7439646.1 hypothetical protein [SAR324 cluster bacterium]MDP7583287.1 hypothetical protein [SAR324 cluster bacterium]|tara:strand:- start:403 stop:570 length:168 start_codon:yes stop_codon:yes gene_type:complete